MAQFVVVYKGGAMADTPEAQQESMDRWMSWFTTLGDAVVQMGSPFTASAAVASDGSTSDATTGLTGYSVLEASDVDDAARLSASCPIFDEGGSVEVFEAVMM
jgi:hypothetical protein